MACRTAFAVQGGPPDGVGAVVVVTMVVVVVVRRVELALVLDESLSNTPAATAPIAPPSSSAPTTYVTNFVRGTSAIGSLLRRRIPIHRGQRDGTTARFAWPVGLHDHRAAHPSRCWPARTRTSVRAGYGVRRRQLNAPRAALDRVTPGWRGALASHRAARPCRDRSPRPGTPRTPRRFGAGRPAATPPGPRRRQARSLPPRPVPWGHD